MFGGFFAPWMLAKIMTIAGFQSDSSGKLYSLSNKGFCDSGLNVFTLVR